MAVLYGSVSHSHETEIIKNSISVSHHQYNEFKTVHHEHHFHVGIFHFIGHLIKTINHADDHADEHLASVQNLCTKKVFTLNRTVNFYLAQNNLHEFSLEAELSANPPPYHLFLSLRLRQPNTPLRAPPAIV